MSQIATQASESTAAAELEQRIRACIESLSYLPTTAAVAMKFIELGKNPEAEPSEYAKVIGSDASLCSKLLALANSSWFGVRNKVTKVEVAVNLLGLGTIRTLAISYCMSGLHNELRLKPDESRMFWQASLCKAVAGRQFAKLLDAKLADEAFAGGLFQDFALPVMFATAKDKMQQILQSFEGNWQSQLNRERGCFRLDHAEIGRVLAQKLALPDTFIDAVAFHHDHARLGEFAGSRALADSVYAASLFPHVLNGWNRENADELRRFVDARTGSTPGGFDDFLQTVQTEFDNLYRYFEEGQVTPTRLAELLESASREAADNTTRLVGTVNELMREAAGMGLQMHHLIKQHDELQESSIRDPLTGVLNRDGLISRANAQLGKAARYGVGVALMYVDIDKFKSVNDAFGHDFGDMALRWTAARIADVTRQHDLVGRIGGDEFALLLYDCSMDDATAVARRIVGSVAREPIVKGKRSVGVSISAGLLWLTPMKQVYTLETLLTTADRLMYEAKKTGGGNVCTRAVGT